MAILPPEQYLRFANLDHPSCLHHHDQIVVDHSGDPVCNGEHCAVVEAIPNCFLDRRVGIDIDGRCGL